MPEASGAAGVIEEFLIRQRKMYAGGDLGAVGQLLAEDVVWHVPGTSPIAGDYGGRAAVIGYFDLRRRLAGGTIRVAVKGLAHHREALVQLADGRARLGVNDVVWRTAGVYRVADGRIAEAWPVPLDQRHFDQVWAATRPAPFLYVQRVRPQARAASTALGHPRFLEFFEAAFIESWRESFDPMDATLGHRPEADGRRAECPLPRPVRCDVELRIDVALDRITQRSIQVHYDAFVKATHAAEAGSRHVCLDAGSGEPTSLPDGIGRQTKQPAATHARQQGGKMTETKSQQTNRFWGNPDSMLRSATVVFLAALLLHGADHMRRGMHAFSTPVTVAGSVHLVLALLTALLVFMRSWWAPVAAIIVGFASTIGFIMVHLLPDCFGPFSDSFIHAPPASRVTGFSWFAAIFEIVADIAVGIAGLRVLQSRHGATSGQKVVR